MLLVKSVPWRPQVCASRCLRWKSTVAHAANSRNSPPTFTIHWNGKVSALNPSGLHDLLDSFAEVLQQDQLMFEQDGRCFGSTVRSMSVSPGPVTGLKMAYHRLQRLVSLFPLYDSFEHEFYLLLWGRLLDRQLLDHFSIAAFDASKEQRDNSLHWKVGPTQHAYATMRVRASFLGLHPWFLNHRLHNSGFEAQHRSKRIYQQYNSILLDLMMEANIPSLQQNEELSHFLEFVYGLYQQLDEVLQAQDRYLLAPSLKYVLWSNVYCSIIPYDAPELTELTVYVVRNLQLVEQMPLDQLIRGDFSWADLPIKEFNEY